jgi:aspartokinase
VEAGIACLQDLCAFDVPLPDGAGRPAALAAVYAACARADAAVHLTAVSAASVSVVVADGPAGDRVASQLGGESTATRRGGLAIVAAVGDGLADGRNAGPGVLAALETIPAHLLSRAPGSNHVACVVDRASLACAVETLHEALFERRPFGRGDDPRAAGAAAPIPTCQAHPQEVRA